MNELQKVVNTHNFFKFKSTDVNLLSCLVCLSDKMADSAVLLTVNQIAGKGSIDQWQRQTKMMFLDRM